MKKPRHTDPTPDRPCLACDEDERRRHTVLGRIGTKLVRLGLWLGGDWMHPDARRGTQ